MFNSEVVMNSRDCSFKFLKSLPILPEDSVIIKPIEQKLIKNKSSIYRWNFRVSHSKNIGWRYP